ncbi:caspase family protein [Myxococcaceae bacterium GXIMD 01537]
MKSLLPLLLLPALALAEPGPPLAEPSQVRRFALLVGVNDGGPGRARLRYAATDAQAFGRVLEELGGVQPADRVMLLEADRAALEGALARLKALVVSARAAGARTEALIYYSGHSDEEGLLLRSDRFAYPELRRALESLPADVKIAVLDSCASGTLARQKGGTRRPAFLVDASASVRGHAILTSSSEDEASQESDRIGGSFFTHNLVSGLRGAADTTGDGRVTLHEAYQFAFHETLARTEKTRAGAQHPAYDIELAGTGELVMTDLRSTAAALALAEPLDGRLYVRDDAGQLVVELNKLAGRATELGLQPGAYTVTRERKGQGSEARFALREGGRAVLAEADFTRVAGEATALRGGGSVEAVPARQSRFFNLALLPMVQTNSVLDGPVDNSLSVALIAARTGRVDGAALAIGANWASDSVSGAQLSAGGNWASGSVEGTQSSVGLNVAGGSVDGVQAAVGANIARGSVEGAQLGVGLNWAGQGLEGFQGGVAANIVRGELRGVQAGAGLNHAETLRGLQLAIVNVGGDVEGAQIGLINVASKARGLQLGFVNLASEMEGVSFGLVSIVRNGQFHVEAYGSDLMQSNVAVKFGGKRFHTILVGGYGRVDGQRQWSLGMGLGAHCNLSASAFVDTDVMASSFYGPGEAWETYRILSQARLLGGWYPTRYLALIAGPTLNVMTSVDERPVGKVTWLGGPSGRGRLSFWPGFQLGLRI